MKLEKRIMKLAEIVLEKKNSKTAQTAWVILFTQNRLILGKRAPSVRNPNLWNFFGGHIDEGESPAEAAARELFEEIKVRVNPSELKEISKFGDATYFAFKVNGLVGKTTSEVSKIETFKLTDLPDNLHSKTENFFNQLETILS